jgi:hypothetical protein
MKHHPSSIQALTHTGRRVPRIGVDPHKPLTSCNNITAQLTIEPAQEIYSSRNDRHCLKEEVQLTLRLDYSVWALQWNCEFKMTETSWAVYVCKNEREWSLRRFQKKKKNQQVLYMLLLRSWEAH